MNLEISTGAYAREYARGVGASTLPPTSVMIKKDSDHWRSTSSSSTSASTSTITSSGGFGLANLLNRTSTSSGASESGPLPKFSLPSLNAFSISRPDQTLHQSRSILSDPMLRSSSSPRSTSGSGSGNLTTSPSSALLHDNTAQQQKTLLSRRIAPAPIDEDDMETDDAVVGSGDSIRGGRWSSDEHDRFLAGFRIHGHKWKRVQQVVRTRSVTQVRTHAQKYLLKLAKLNAEKKPNDETLDGESISRPRLDSISDTDGSMTQSTVDEYDPSSRSPLKKPRRQSPGQGQVPTLSLNQGQGQADAGFADPSRFESLDEAYITAAASTLCLLMRQKMDSFVDATSKTSSPPHGLDDDRDLEPYDCYSTSSPSSDARASRKRPYMHFITDGSDEYSNFSREQPVASETAIESKQACS